MRFSPVPAREHAVVLEFRPGEARGAHIEFGAEQRIVLRRNWTSPRNAPLPSFLKLKQFRKTPVIVSLHPTLAHTFILPFRLHRKKSDPALLPGQFQSLLQGFLEKTTLEMRGIASEELGVEELDAILLDARLARLLVNGVETREDQMIEGQKVEGFLQVIFVTRDVFHDLHELVHSKRRLFFTERGPAALSFLARSGAHPAAFLDLEPGEGHLFRLDYDADEALRKTGFKWDVGRFPSVLADEWSLSPGTAAALYESLLAAGLSEAVGNTVTQLFNPILEDFDRVLEKSAPRTKKRRLFVRSSVPLPFALPATRGGVELASFPLEDLLEESGIVFDPNGADDASFLLLPFLEYYYHRGDPEAHRALTRHIHWIAP